MSCRIKVKVAGELDGGTVMHCNLKKKNMFVTYPH